MRIAIVALSLASLLPAQADKISDFAFDCRTLGGQSISQDTYRDNVLIVDLWGTWCPPCREAVPKLVALYAKYKHHGLEIVGFNYASNGAGEDADKVRSFAVEHGITYPLAIGSKAIREQVPGFRGYPTLLFFRKGLEHDHTDVGFQSGHETAIEQWVREQLGLDQPTDKKSEAAQEQEAERKEVAKEKVPPGRIFMPGNADTGFDFVVDDIDGKSLAFADLRGAPVLFALTTTWDQEAKRTAALLEQLRTAHPRLAVVAACIEKGGDAEQRRKGVEAFRRSEGLGCRLFAADLRFATEKIHQFAALPTLLLFDDTGKLIQREGGYSDAVVERLQIAVAQLAR